MNRGQFKAGNKGKFKPLSWRFEGTCVRCTSHALNSKGYAQFARTQNGKTQTIHRTVMLNRYGDQPAGTVARHTCDNSWCINPEHIIPGTVTDNNRDMMQRGRWRHGGRWKVSPELEAEIKACSGSLRSLAYRFAVSQTTVWNIKHKEGAYTAQ